MRGRTARPMTVVVRVGDEYDEALIGRVRSALSVAGAKRTGHSWGVGGSQEIAHEEWSVDGVTLTLEAETYEGLTLSGDREFVERILADLSGDRG